MKKTLTTCKNNSKLSILFVFSFLLISCNQKPKISCEISATVTYSKDVAQIIESKCFKCHAKDVYKEKAQKNKIYDYESLKEMAKEGYLLGAITHQPGFIAMPYRAKKKIDTCAIALIAKWIDKGMKE